MNFYSENDPYAAQFLRNLIAAGLIPPGTVDERDMREIEPFELSGYTQCHFFAGIGVWPLALRNAGWPDNEPIWTGSCPCQPFSSAGQQKGFSDARHLWPYWFALIAERKPSRIVGEQVASALEWLDLVSSDLEKANYAFGASDLCAAGFGGAHIRQRLYFVGLGDTECNNGRRQHGGCLDRAEKARTGKTREGAQRFWADPANGDTISGLADDDDTGLEGRHGLSERGNQCAAGSSGLAGGVEHADLPGQHERAPGGEQSLCVVGDGRDEGIAIRRAWQARSLDNVDWLLCRNPDGEPSWRPVEPGTFPLAHGVAARMGKLRSYGNALDAETATEFCKVIAEIVGIRPVEFPQEYDL